MPVASWDWSDSDLTALSSDEEVEPAPLPTPAPAISRPKINTRPSTKEATVKSRKNAKTKPHLDPPRPASYSAELLHSRLKNGTIDLNPEYQRSKYYFIIRLSFSNDVFNDTGVVWSEAKQTALIDSLIHNYYIPPVIFSVKNNGSSVRRVCIDGKQRLTSIQQFMDGVIPHKDTFTNRKSYYINPPGQKRKLLANWERENFETQQIMCVEYYNLTDEDEREIFQRVQMGVALTPAERMNALNSPYATLAREVQATRQLFDDYLQFEDTRGREYLAIAQIIYMIHFDGTPKEPTNPNVESFLNKREPVDPRVRKYIIGAINIFCLLIQDPVLGKPLCNSRHKLQPVEFVMAVYLIHFHRFKLSLTQLSDAIEKLRDDLRRTFKDIRFNTCYKHMLAFVLKGINKASLNGDKQGNIPAASLDLKALMKEATAAASRGASSPLQRKRKRVEHENDADSESDVPLYTQRKSFKGALARKRDVIPDQESDEEAIIKPVSLSKAKAPASRGPIGTITGNGVATSSKAMTTVKHQTLKIKSSKAQSVKPTAATPWKNASSSQVATPSIKPPVSARTKSNTRATISSSSTLPTSIIVPQINIPPTYNDSASIKFPSHHPQSGPGSTAPMMVDPPQESPGSNIKNELERSLASISLGPPSVGPVLQPTSSRPDRLASLRAVKKMLTKATGPRPPQTLSPTQMTRDPRRLLAQPIISSSSPRPDTTTLTGSICPDAQSDNARTSNQPLSPVQEPANPSQTTKGADPSLRIKQGVGSLSVDTSLNRASAGTRYTSSAATPSTPFSSNRINVDTNPARQLIASDLPLFSSSSTTSTAFTRPSASSSNAFIYEGRTSVDGRGERVPRKEVGCHSRTRSRSPEVVHHSHRLPLSEHDRHWEPHNENRDRDCDSRGRPRS